MHNPWGKKPPQHPGMDAFDITSLIYKRGTEKAFKCPKCESAYRPTAFTGVGVYDRCLPSSGKVWSHSLNAYRGGRMDHDIVRKGVIVAMGSVAKLGPVICCVDRGTEMGTVGLYVTGGELARFAGDVWSEADHLGRRFPGENAIEIEVDQRSHLNYDETFVRPYAVTGVWLRLEASEWDARAAEQLAEMLGVPLYDEVIEEGLEEEDSFRRISWRECRDVFLDEAARYDRLAKIRDYKRSLFKAEDRETELYEIQDALEAS